MTDFGSENKGIPLPQWLTIALLALIACSLLVIAGLLLGSSCSKSGREGQSVAGASGPPAPSPTAVAAGQTAKRKDVPKPPPPPPTIGKPDRIRDVLLEGRTYEVTAGFTLTGPVRDKQWGFENLVHMNYVAEVQFTRRIERNDGRRVEELRHIKHSRMLKAESTAEFRLVWTEPGTLLLAGLAGLDLWTTGGQILLQVPAILGLIEDVYKQGLNDVNTKVKAALDSLEGKQFRVVYEDGVGVVELTPAGCDLTTEERDFLMSLSVVSDAYLLPDQHSKVGDSWEVPPEAFSDFLPSGWRGRPRGNVVIRRVKDFEQGGHQFARLEIQSGSFEVVATDSSWERIGSLTPRGWLEYDITDGYVKTGELRASASVHQASRDHLLFETRFETSPQARSTYSCRLLP